MPYAMGRKLVGIMKIGVVVFPGSNCDHDCQYIFKDVLGQYVEMIWHKETLLAGLDAIVLPGGFSYGDYLRTGAIARFSPVMGAVKAFANKGGLVIGICNGFQILVKSGLLLDDEPSQPAATLTWNDSGRFLCRWVKLRTAGSKCVFFQGIERMYLPMAHAEGKFVPRDEQIMSRLEAGGQLALRYDDDNPNGSTADVAGVCDSTGRVCGLMPHPERHLDPTHHPRWTRGEAGSVGDGLKVFQNAVAYFN